ncbi:hypothetical protein KKF61_03890 [Patescibacteria group bacterium]|nr:hypothetical protein [Patescibacteria group bacterium]MBU0963943.1 hypothetical protein [Patescibacteria group bacterium]
MQDDKWQDIIGRVKDDFEVLENKTKDLDEGPGSVEFIIFNGPLGKMKLERISRPIVLDKKGIGSRRIGSQTSVQYTYSETEKSHKFKAYKWNDEQNDWVAMEAGESFQI